MNKVPTKLSRALFAVAVAGALALTAGVGGATESVTTRRIGGVDRYDTAARLSASAFSACDEVVLARGDAFPDALAGSYPAGRAAASDSTPGCALLLTGPERLPPATEAELNRLGPSLVTLMGGEGAIGVEIEEGLADQGYRTRRLAGATRYATAAAAATSVGGAFPDQVIVVSGEDFPDAMAAGPLAFAEGLPVLLTPTSTLHPATRDVLAEYRPDVLVVGGTAAVSEDVVRAMRAVCAPDTEANEADCIQVIRVAGVDRAGTATAMADWARQEFGWSLAHVNLARGDAFPDAVAGAAHAGGEAAPVLFAQTPDRLGAATGSYLANHNASVSSIDAFGSQAAISDSVLAAARDAATS